MIEIRELTKTFKGNKAIDGVSFVARDGRVTGFLGPNGAGKSTTMRAALGLIAPDSGQALIDGRPFVSNPAPMRAVGAVLDAKSAHKSRSAYDHLRALALTNGIPKRRVDEVISLTGLESVKKRKAGQFSLGMSQRLSIAAALLGDPRNLVLDEPINGLDPEGVRWVRELCRYYAAQGKAVLLSSHLMSEVALTADDLVIIGRGRVLETTTVTDFVAEHSRRSLRVATPEPERLRQVCDALAAGGIDVGGSAVGGSGIGELAVGAGSAPGPRVSAGPGGVVRSAMAGPAVIGPVALRPTENRLAESVNVESVARGADDPTEGEVLRITGLDYRTAAHAFAQAGLVVYEFIEEHASLEEAYMALTHDSVQYSAASVPNRGSVSGVINGNVTGGDVAGVRDASAVNISNANVSAVNVANANISGASDASANISAANISGAASNASKGAQR